MEQSITSRQNRFIIRYRVKCCVSLSDLSLSSTHADRQGEDISVTVCFVCTVTDISGDDKASGVKFCTVVQGRPGQGISNLGELCSPRSPNKIGRIGQTPGRKVQGGKSFRNWVPINITRCVSGRSIGMCGYTAEDGRICTLLRIRVLRLYSCLFACLFVSSSSFLFCAIM